MYDILHCSYHSSLIVRQLQQATESKQLSTKLRSFTLGSSLLERYLKYQTQS